MQKVKFDNSKKTKDQTGSVNHQAEEDGEADFTQESRPLAKTAAMADIYLDRPCHDLTQYEVGNEAHKTPCSCKADLSTSPQARSVSAMLQMRLIQRS